MSTKTTTELSDATARSEGYRLDRCFRILAEDDDTYTGEYVDPYESDY